MRRPLGIAALQMAPVLWDPKATVDKVAQITEEVSRTLPWVDLLVGPELALSGFALFSPLPAPTADLAVPIPGPLTDRLCEIAGDHHKWLVPGSLWEREDDRVFNTALAISPEGTIVARYRKLFPWMPYEAGTTPGTDFTVFDIPGVGRFGLTICYDTWFPEVARTLAWKGAEVILHPSTTPTSDRQLEIVIAQATSIFNQCYYVDANGVGPWGGGRSVIADPDGRVLQEAPTGETVLSELIDLDRVTVARERGTLGLSQLWKQLRDQRVEFPVYREGFAAGDVNGTLGTLEFQRGVLADPHSAG